MFQTLFNFILFNQNRLFSNNISFMLNNDDSLTEHLLKFNNQSNKFKEISNFHDGAH